MQTVLERNYTTKYQIIFVYGVSIITESRFSQFLIGTDCISARFENILLLHCRYGDVARYVVANILMNDRFCKIMDIEQY